MFTLYGWSLYLLSANDNHEISYKIHSYNVIRGIYEYCTSQNEASNLVLSNGKSKLDPLNDCNANLA